MYRAPKWTFVNMNKMFSWETFHMREHQCLIYVTYNYFLCPSPQLYCEENESMNAHDFIKTCLLKN